MRTIRLIATAGTALVLASASMSAQAGYHGQQNQSDELCQIVVNGQAGRAMRCDVARASAPRNARIISSGNTGSRNDNRDWRYAAEQQRMADRMQRERIERERERARIERERAIEQERARRERNDRDRYRRASYDHRDR